MQQVISLKFYQTANINVRFGMKQVDVEIPLVVNDTGPTLQFNCINHFDNSQIDLTGKIVYFSMKLSGSDYSAKGLCEIVEPSVSGIVRYQFVSGDLTYPGTYFGDIAIVDGPIVETCPDAVRFQVRERNE
jgi:hypothetical protein